MSTLNTIAPAPKIARLSPRSRAFGIILGFAGAGVANVALGYSAFSFWTRQTKFVPYSPSPAENADLTLPVFQQHNPLGNTAICIDHAVRTVPLAKLKTTELGGTEGLTTQFCRGVWSGAGYAYQRRYLEKKYRGLEGRDKDVWDREDLGKSAYEVGTRITDHFEVVEHGEDRVVVRCGDSPHNAGLRPSDGLFSMEVTKDEDKGIATFHLKSVFVNTTEEGRNSVPLNWRFQFAHRLYTKLWMETAVRNVMKTARQAEEKEGERVAQKSV
ncbi:hypothetical protein P154DRAFT_621100 [Amniculicola lignicola CBS 123094]|uniref:DUF1990 domain-containing protein n=1 Tax=Amniculicola lignicola CBS 123094 TaxID=1392246 RepID=A0A6A5WDP2_9PLEO|nr:hypothetical protein P154DRAFT_621100 [Amniculicola lignicola CBS 123094]